MAVLRARLRGELPLTPFFFDLLHVDGTDLLVVRELTGGNDRGVTVGSLLRYDPTMGEAHGYLRDARGRVTRFRHMVEKPAYGQKPPRLRMKVHTSVTSTGVSLPATRRPVVRSVAGGKDRAMPVGSEAMRRR